MKQPSHEAMKALYYFIYKNIYPRMSDEKKSEILARSKNQKKKGEEK